LLLRNHFVKAPERQRFYYVGPQEKNRYEVDIVPFGEVENDGMIAWPPEGSPVMSVRCFSEVMNHADMVTVEGAFSFRLASLSGQFLLKLDTWSDRHYNTRKDASDMVYFLQNVYVAYALTRDGLPQEVDVEATTFDITVAGAEWIAADLRTILSPHNRQYYAAMLQQEVDKEDESLLLNDMLDVSDSSNYALFRRALTRMSQILES
jgi:predicted nucleotidyltransferase